MKKVFLCTLLFFVCLLTACNNVSNSGTIKQTTDSKFAVIKFNNIDVRAAVSESYQPLEVKDEDIVAIEFIVEGIKDDGSVYPADFIIEASSESYTGKWECSGNTCVNDFLGCSFLILPGNYNFYLNLYTSNLKEEKKLTLSAKKLNQTLEAGEDKTLSFTATYAEEGDLSITYEWPVNDRVGDVKMGLFYLDDLINPVYGYAMKKMPFEEKVEEAYYSAKYNAVDLDNGVYWLKIELYDTNTNSPAVIATYLDLVSIYGYKTIGTKVLNSDDYNQNYFINFHLAEDEKLTSWANLPDRHNQYQAVILYPDTVEKNDNTEANYIFKGWYTDPEFSPESKLPVSTIDEEEVQIIALGTDLHTQDLTLYPKFEQLVLYSINIGGDTPIQPVEEIVVKDKDGTQILDCSEEHSWRDYFKKFEQNVYTVGSKSPFAEITSISRRGYNLRWNVVYERKDGTRGETFLDSLPVFDCGTLVVTNENGETITYNDIISINVAASWISYQTDLNYYFMSEDNSYQQKETDILSTTLSKYNPEEENKRNSIAELFDGGYVLNKAKSTYNCDAESHQIVINNYFDKLDSDLAFKAESEGGRTFTFYYTDLTTGDGIFNISKTFTEIETGTTSYTAYEYLGIGRYVENKLSLLYLWEYALRGNNVEATYASIIEDYGQSAAWKHFNELVSSGEPANGFEQLTVTTDTGTGTFFNSAITSSNIKYTIDSSSVGTIVHSAFNQNREIGSLVINVSTDNLSGYTNANPADLNAKPSLSFDIQHGDGSAMKADDIISVNIDLLWNNANLISWDGKKLENTYFYVNNEPDDPDAAVLNPANDTQTIYFKSLPNAGTYQLYIKVSWAVDDNLVYTGSYSTTFVVNDTLKYDLNSLVNPTDIKKDLENANGIVNVKISGDYAGYSEWAAVIENLSIALSDGFITNDRNDFFVNLDLSGVENMSAFSNGIKNEYNNVEGTKGKLLTLKFPSSVSTINQDAVKGFGNLYTIELPANVTDINSNAFEGSGRKFILDESNETFALGSNDTVILGSDDKNLIAFAGGKKQLLIPDTVTSLPYDINTSNVESLYVPDSVEDIQSLDTSNLKELSINAQVTSVSANGTLTNTLPYLQKLTLRGDYTGENDFEAPAFQSGSGDSPEKYPVGTNVAKILAYCADTLKELTFDGDVVIPETKFSNPVNYPEGSDTPDPDYVDFCVNFFTRFTQRDSENYEVSSTKLKSLTFNGAATIGKQAFYHCEGLSYWSHTLNLTVFASSGVIIEFNSDNPSTIGENAFGQLGSVEFDHIKLQGVTSIGKEAFSPLHFAGDNPYIEFSDSLIKLGPRAFGWNFSDVSKLKGIDYSVWYTTNDPAVWSSYEGLAETVLRKKTTSYTRKTYDSLSKLLTELNDLSNDEQGNQIYNYLVRPVSN